MEAMMPLSPEAQRLLATMTRDDAEYFVMMAERTGLAGPKVDAAYELLRRVYRPEAAEAPGQREKRNIPGQSPGVERTEPGAGAAAADIPSPFDEVPDAAVASPAGPAATFPTAEAEPDRDAWDAEDEPQLAPIEFVLAQEPYRRRYVRVPLLWIDGEIGARLERACPGLAWLVVILLKYADRAAHIISCSKVTLRQEAGIGDDRTLDRRIALLCTGKPELGLPPLLRPLPGYGGKFAFRADGLAALVQLAQRTVADREARFAAMQKARSQGGQAAMQRRWEKSR